MSPPSKRSNRPRRWLLRLALCVTVVAHTVALAGEPTLGALKQQGVVGEQVDGYLGFVRADADADARALIEQINTERRAAYTEIATRTGAALEQVAKLAGGKLVAAAPSGQFVWDSTGRWKRK